MQSAGEPLAKQCREFDRRIEEMEKALSHLKEAIKRLPAAFAPALRPESPEPISDRATKEPTQVPTVSAYQGSMNSYISRINQFADDIEELCSRSEI